MKFPKLSQWKQIFKVFKRVERVFFLIFVILAVSSLAYLSIDFYLKYTMLAPAYGGTFVEGVVGQPRFINPIYGETNDIDRTLIDLVYSGLMTYDKDGKLTNDLAQSYQISEDGRTYTFVLKDNLYWQDGEKLTADDVIYTIKTVQNSDYKSPLRVSWLNVDAVKLSDNSIALSLGAPYNSFLENCTLKIIPQHIWKNVLPENFALSAYNLQPVGSGFYTLTGLKSKTGFIESLTLDANHKYSGKQPYISKIHLKFFRNEADLISAANQKTIDGFSISAIDESLASMEKQVKRGWALNQKFEVYSFSLPRYFAVFFNTQSSKIFADVNITQALNYSVNKEELIQKLEDVFKEKSSIVNSPILSDYFGYPEPTITYAFDATAAGKLLDKSGYKDTGNETQGTLRAKANDKKPAFQFTSYLKIGSSGSQVTELQGCLARLDNSFATILQGETSGKYGEATGDAVTAFQQKYLSDTPSTGEVGPGTRKKLNELCLVPQDNSIPFMFTLTTINQPQLVTTANLLKDYWQNIGATVNIKTVELSELKDIIKNRDYDALLYGEALSSMPDLYPFWHSTQINDPGLNLSSYQNKKVDLLLKDARETLDESLKIEKYASLQDIILQDAPALFLYNPNYFYWVSEKVKGIDTSKIVDPSKRFENIANWHIKTKRVWK